MRTDRRAQMRYVVDGLMLEIGGIAHETLDLSTSAVAVIRKPGVDYKMVKPPFRFKFERSVDADCRVSTMKLLREGRADIVFDYRVEGAEWESVLKRHDVRADVEPLEDVFG